MNVREVAAAILLGMAASSAEAHTGFIVPDRFHYPSCGPIGAIASFSDRFPAPEVALQSDNFAIVTSDGERLEFDSTQPDHALTRLIARLDTPGTYRLTSGVRLGRTSQIALTDRGFLRLDTGEDSVDPSLADAEVLTSRTVTVSEVSLSCAKLQEQPQRATDGRLSIRPLSDHIDGTRQAFEILFDNAVVPIDEIRLVSAYQLESDNLAAKLDAQGTLNLGQIAPGAYTLLVRLIAHAPPDSDTDLHSFSTALTFEIRTVETQAD